MNLIRTTTCILSMIFCISGYADEKVMFNKAKVLALAEPLAKGYFSSEHYGARNYDQKNPLIGSFEGKDCDQSKMNLVYVSYIAENPENGILWSVFKVVGIDEYILMGEGPGGAKDIKGLIQMWQSPDMRDCHYE